uniref:Thiamine transporter 2 n=1 Tax=Xenopus tropicalis TaxID=8364 RepID=A0A6I8Q1T1_XENTR
MAGCCKQYTSGWKFPTVLLCLYGLFANLKPLDPFFIAYLVGPHHNLTTEQVTGVVFPVWTYSYLALLVPAFLLTDYLRYKPVIILQGLAITTTLLLLLFTHGVPAMQAMDFVYAVCTACDPAYYAYIYSVVGSEHYQRVTGFCRSITLVGCTLGSVIGQMLVSLAGVSYFNLNIISVTSTSVALLCSLFLPMPSKSMFVHRTMAENTIEMPPVELESPHSEQTQSATGTEIESKSTGSNKCLQVFGRLGKEMKECYSSMKILYWSLWWAFATAGYTQVINYIQLLWEHVEPSQKFSIYNGGAEAISTFLGAILSFSVAYVKVNWDVFGELALTIFSAIDAGAIFFMVYSRNIWMCYAGYIIFKSCYMLLITIATYQLAFNLSMERYALLFGFNTFVALALQTILTLIVVDPRGLALDIVTQFIVYGSCFSVIAGIILIRSMYLLIPLYCKGPVSHLHKAITARTNDYGLN